MVGGLVESAARIDEPEERRIYGLTVAQVVKNCDETHAGRVQVRFSWLPGYEPWARLALIDRGVFFIPQVGDEVLVELNRGDVSEVYVVGCLWNGKDQPPATKSGDPVHKRIIRTPKNHEIVFDDETNSISITTKIIKTDEQRTTEAEEQKITIDQNKIEIITKSNTASLTLESTGEITLHSNVSIHLDAPSISISGDKVEITSKANTDISGGKLCSIDGELIKIG